VSRRSFIDFNTLQTALQKNLPHLENLKIRGDIRRYGAIPPTVTGLYNTTSLFFNVGTSKLKCFDGCGLKWVNDADLFSLMHSKNKNSLKILRMSDSKYSCSGIQQLTFELDEWETGFTVRKNMDPRALEIKNLKTLKYLHLRGDWRGVIHNALSRMENLLGFSFSYGKFPEGMAVNLVELSERLQWIAFNGMTFNDPAEKNMLINDLKCEQFWDRMTVGCWF
jgi:hypothetical protein